jgi:hypothetical protein
MIGLDGMAKVQSVEGMNTVRGRGAAPRQPVHRADGPEIAKFLVAGFTDTVAGVPGDELREIAFL